MFACMNNLKQMALGHLVWQLDHDGAMPWEVSVTSGGTLEHIAAGDALAHYRVVSKYIPDVEVLTCPADKERESASSYDELTRENLSYFLSLQAGTNPIVSILAGDRNLEVNGQPVQTGLLTSAATDQVVWSAGIHPTGRHGTLGCMAFLDGHVETSRDPQQLLQRSGVTTNRLLIP